MKLKLATVALGAALLAACSSTATKQARDVKPSTFLGEDARLLEKGEKGQALMRYQAPNVDWKAYSRILLMPVEYWTDPGKKDKLPEATRKKLTDYAYSAIHDKLAKDWQMVSQPSSGTIRLKVAIVDAESANVSMDTISTVIPQAFVLGKLKEGITGKPAAVGEVQAEIKATDAQDGRLLVEAVDKRYGAKGFKGKKFSKWDDVETALRYWASQTAYKLCTLRGAADCQAPTEK
jgi:hypothetical protein